MKGFLAERLTAFRKANGMTATQCAAELEISIAAWSQYEKAKRDPPLSDLPKICWMFRCSADQLLGLKDSAALSVHAGDGAAVAIGANARASAAAKSAADCRTCPYKKWGEKLRKQGLIIPGVE